LRGEAHPSMRRSVAVKENLLTRFVFFPFAFLGGASYGRRHPCQGHAVRRGEAHP
jgi:hypothetical protein